MTTTTLHRDAGVTVDARPVRPTSNTTPWDRALALRDRIADLVRETLAKEGVDAAVFVSQNGEYPPWVMLEAWLPGGSDPASRERAELQFTIDCKPYYEHDIVVSARLVRGKKKIAVNEQPEFPNHNVAEWVMYALGRGRKPGNYTPILDAILGLFVHSNRLSSDYRPRFTGANVLGIIGVLLLVASLSEITNEPVLGLLMMAGGVGALIAAGLIMHFRTRSVSVTPQSQLPPRHLGLVDSWHVVVAELGRDFSNVRNRLINAVTADVEPGVAAQTETYTHRAPNGYEQRERLVLGKDQGMVHVHIYQFGHDVFVGWHAYLNWAQWGETNPVSMNVRKGQEVEFRDLRPSVYVPNQFDLIDLSSLSEFVHRRLEREIKALLKEKAIDQEIDFKVIRGDRDHALDEARHKGQEKKSGWIYRRGS